MVTTSYEYLGNVGSMIQTPRYENLRIEIGDIWIDPPGARIDGIPAAFTNIDADVRIYLGRRKFLDADLCLVEFAAAVNKWLSSPKGVHSSFRFESSDDDEPNILSFEPASDGIRIASAWQNFRANEPIATDQLTKKLRDFVEEVFLRCRADLNLEVKNWIA